MEHPARKITKIAREAEHLVLLAMRGEDVGTAEIDCIHAVRHHPGITQTELAAMLKEHDPKARIIVVDYEPVTGSHVGPGALAMFYVARQDD